MWKMVERKGIDLEGVWLLVWVKDKKNISITSLENSWNTNPRWKKKEEKKKCVINAGK